MFSSFSVMQNYLKPLYVMTCHVVFILNHVTLYKASLCSINVMLSFLFICHCWIFSNHLMSSSFSVIYHYRRPKSRTTWCVVITFSDIAIFKVNLCSDLICYHLFLSYVSLFKANLCSDLMCCYCCLSCIIISSQFIKWLHMLSSMSVMYHYLRSLYNDMLSFSVMYH